MRYFNLSAFRQLREYWLEFSLSRQITITWIGVSLFISVIFFISQLVMPENPTVFRYFLSLYAINSIVLFVVIRENATVSWLMLAFLFALILIVAAYYGLNYLSLGIG